MSSDAGFTLVELLVATFITALLAVLGMMLTSDTMRARDQLTATVDDVRDLELTRAILKSDLAQLVPRQARDAYGTPADSAFVGGPHRGADTLMTFVRTGRELPGLADAHSRLEFVAYSVSDGALVRTSRQNVDAVPGMPEAERVLLSGLEGVEIAFLEGGRWQDVWAGSTSVTGTGGIAPVAIRLRFDHPHYGDIEMRVITGAGL